jgi:hypothetical protein
MVLLLLLLALGVGQSAFAQLSETQIRVLQQAVADIAMRNHAVAHLIYDGMTVNDVEAILAQRIIIEYHGIVQQQPGGGSTFTFVQARPGTNHGNYIIVWSNLRAETAVVVGYQRRGESVVHHNYIDDSGRVIRQ